MSNNDLLAYLTLSQFLVAAKRAIQHVLAQLSFNAVCYILIITYVVLIAAAIAMLQSKSKPAYEIGSIKIPAWVVPFLFSLLMAALLLL